MQTIAPSARLLDRSLNCPHIAKRYIDADIRRLLNRGVPVSIGHALTAGCFALKRKKTRCNEAVDLVRAIEHSSEIECENFRAGYAVTPMFDHEHICKQPGRP